MDKDKQTTIFGVMAAIGVILVTMGNIMDGNPDTMAQWNDIAGPVAMIGGLLGWSWQTNKKG